MEDDISGKVDSMFMENLEEWILEENKVVTYKYLSKSIKVHVNVAKQMLYNFVQEQTSKGNKNLGIVYLLSGFMKSEKADNPKLKVVMIKEKDLDTQIKKFDKILTKHIYSVQSHDKISSTNIYATDMMSVREDISSCNAHNAIKNKAAVPRPNQAYVQPSSSKTTKEVVKQEVKKESQPIPLKKDENKKSPAKKSPITKKEETKKSSTTAAAANKATAKKGGNSIASMFAKQSAAAASKPPVSKPKEELASKTSPGKENMENTRLEEQRKDGSGEKKADKKPTVKAETKTAKNNKKPTGKPAKKNESSMKRKRIQVTSDSEESENDEEDNERAAESDNEGPPRARIIESDEETEEIPSTPQPTSNGNGRRKVRKEVDKTYIDDKGFMVTKKEYVYESEDEEPQPPKPEVKKVSPLTKKTSPPAADKKSSGPAAKKAKLMAGAAKQPGIMSFFKKK